MSVSVKKVGVIGGGAAGFFAAINCKINFPEHEVHLLEKSNKTLAKVKISGGGRCNVTHHCFEVGELIKFYPRGGKQLKKVFSNFQPLDTIEWFKKRGVELKKEADNRMFPITDKSYTIINCFHEEIEKLGIHLHLNFPVNQLKKNKDTFEITSKDETHKYDYLIIAAGGHPKLSGFDWLASTGHNVIPPVPSLFTFNMPNEHTADLMGIVAPMATVKVQGTKIQQKGPLLFTHWGMSGPAILKTSAWGARSLSEMNYNFTISVNWSEFENEELIRNELLNHKKLFHKKKILNANPFKEITARLWSHLLIKSGITETLIWAECPKKQLNKLVNNLFNDTYEVKGKTTFKEEFVTCGGIDLSEINMKTMESKKLSNLFFAGEVLNLDGVTGGFNFQAAWSTAFLSAKLGQPI